MADCFLCGDFVGEDNGDGGVKGRTIGTRDICERCIAELKYCMNSIEAKSPIERTISDAENEDTVVEEEVSEERVEENFDPASSGVKI